MIMILSLALSLIFMILGGFHIYWLFGGTYGVSKVIPTKQDQSILPAIPKLATLIVALVLLSFGMLYLIKSGIITLQIPALIENYAYWFIPIIFILRAIGEFNYVGFFKRIKDTEFAKADSKLFSPLCLVIGVFGLLIQLTTIVNQ